MQNGPTSTFLSPMQQYLRFAERGMHFDPQHRSEDVQRIQEIGYYKLKEYAYEMSKFDRYGNLQYVHTDFENVVKKYLRDKQLRQAMFQGILDIEPYLVNAVVSVLGKRYGAFEYWNVALWMDRGMPRIQRERFELRFRQSVSLGAKGSGLPDLDDPMNRSSKYGCPSVWLLGDFVTFGTLTAIVAHMSLANKKRVARYFQCTPNELVSWLKTIGYVRNQCAHNHNLIDIRIHTKPIVPPKCLQKLVRTGGRVTDRIALVLVVFRELIIAVNPRYDFDTLNRTLEAFFEDQNFTVTRLGFVADLRIDESRAD